MSEALEDDDIAVTQKQIPALYQHCKTVYRAMFDKAGKRADNKVVYTGFLTRLMKEPPVSLSTPMYSSVTTALKDMGCIIQLKRGGGGTASVWQLIGEPSVEKYFSIKTVSDLAAANNVGNTGGGGKRYEEVLVKIADLYSEVGEFDAFIRKTQDALIQQGTSIQKLQEEIRELKIQNAKKGETLVIDL